MHQNETAFEEPARARAWLHGLSLIVVRAAAAIASASAVARTKPDGSPVTAADEASEAVILEGLAQLAPGLPIVSEEGAHAAPPAGATFALVDPLDGTREFVAGRPEYTINIALVTNGTPTLGVLAAPALGLIWRGACGLGAERLSFRDSALGVATALHARKLPRSEAVAFVSRSHLDAASADMVARLGARPETCGSALKFARLAEGAGDIYPRLAPTSEWDVAAGHALLTAAGGDVTAPDGTPLVYGRAKDRFIIPGFIACGDAAGCAAMLGKR